MPAAAEDLALAFELADVADAITMARFGAEDLVVDTKPDLTPVSEADRAVELALRERLASARPQDAVLGEEFGSVQGAGPRRWIIDPIDGTKSYVRGIPTWSTLIALSSRGRRDRGRGLDARAGAALVGGARRRRVRRRTSRSRSRESTSWPTPT